MITMVDYTLLNDMLIQLVEAGTRYLVSNVRDGFN